MDVEMSSCCCADCGISFAIPAALVKSLRECHNTFYCPNGHRNYYPAKTMAEDLEERLLLAQEEIAKLKKPKRKPRKTTTKKKAAGG